MSNRSEFIDNAFDSKACDTAAQIILLFSGFAIGSAVWILGGNLLAALLATLGVMLALFSIHQVGKMVVYGIKEILNH